MYALLLAGGIFAQSTIAVRHVAIASFDGQQLEATYYDPGVAGPAALIFRNCDQKRASVDEFAQKLSARGVHVVAYDYRDGQAAGRSWNDTRRGDATHIRAWLVSQPRVDSTRQAAVGGSCGVQVALNYAMSHPAGLHAVVILSGPSSADHTAFIARMHGLSVLGATSTAEGGERTGFIQPVVAASTNPDSRMIIVPTGHGTEILKHDAPFEATVLEWLATRLSLRPPTR